VLYSLKINKAAELELSIQVMNRSMKTRSRNFHLFILSVLLSVCTASVFSQQVMSPPPDEKSLEDHDIFYEPGLTFRYDRYSKADLSRLNARFDALKESKFSNEWEGNYFFTAYEHSYYPRLRLDLNIGYARTVVVAALRDLEDFEFGRVMDEGEAILFIPDFQSWNRGRVKSSRYVKVRWDEAHFLVEESSLLAFAQKAAGLLNGEEYKNDHKWTGFWHKDSLQRLNGLPVFPAKFRHLERAPIIASLISVGDRVIRKDFDLNKVTYNENVAVYAVTINAGADRGVRREMRFLVPEIRELLHLTKVGKKTADGLIVRDLTENLEDRCFDFDHDNLITCPNIRNAMKITTRTGLLY